MNCQGSSGQRFYCLHYKSCSCRHRVTGAMVTKCYDRLIAAYEHIGAEVQIHRLQQGNLFLGTEGSDLLPCVCKLDIDSLEGGMGWFPVFKIMIYACFIKSFI